MSPTALTRHATDRTKAEPPAVAPVTSTTLIELLEQPAAYPDRPSRVLLVETHISWVFITDRYVYKLKKPVRFDFVDFSTPENAAVLVRPNAN